jgi:MurNAc alpha-1-phosphate uridylyltransferase
MSIGITRAMVLAAGLGTRMRPLTNTLPKPLIAVHGKPLIDWCLDWLSAGGVTDAVVNTSYLATMLEGHLSARSAPHLHFSREGEPPLETGGGIAKALPLLGDGPFVAMNSDAILPPAGSHPIARLSDAWRDDIDFLMLLVPKAQAHGWSGNGDFILGEDGRIRRPRAGEEAMLVFTGVEIIHPRAFHDCPAGAFSLSLLWQRDMDADGWFSRVRAIEHAGAWLNVGDLDGLKTAEAYGVSGSGAIGS